MSRVFEPLASAAVATPERGRIVPHRAVVRQHVRDLLASGNSCVSQHLSWQRVRLAGVPVRLLGVWMLPSLIALHGDRIWRVGCCGLWSRLVAGGVVQGFTMYVCAQAGTRRPEDFGVVRAEEGSAEIALIKFADADILDADPSDSMPCTNTTFMGMIVGQNQLCSAESC